ncbi:MULTISPECIES: ATP-binding protein [Thermomonospora]|uniref:Putative anti-sigma regulatory factor, serine/threonine protein kinase n=1 Tax=Thermomonospora curvata (strain ATCC 19995 / DSM 43183 / JCM 3096 / KCTC 9072 / NBRC 15933 / NCIMB 10081 / Henssen B9) TaxID=471852 RepID=D1AES7_THECD|nr:MULTISPECIES: ATP-binding protein [Thermomonospora]ACY97652.1 putative anti-sigma regulatory factor, serine/threonine protein kinase [Thermomonospora curvata DSM 43183]PKK14398.1 MAG: ATP-binding protein [Thermomonospora sp. CIF 1]
MPAGRTGPAGTVRGILTFEGNTEDVARARRFVQDVLRDHPDCATAVLLTSEFVTNGIVHGSGAITVAVLETEWGVRVEVTDAGSGTRPRLRESGLEDEGGRGLLLVDRLASRWDHVRTPAGLTAWFELDTAPAG